MCARFLWISSFSTTFFRFSSVFQLFRNIFLLLSFAYFMTTIFHTHLLFLLLSTTLLKPLFSTFLLLLLSNEWDCKCHHFIVRTRTLNKVQHKETSNMCLCAICACAIYLRLKSVYNIYLLMRILVVLSVWKTFRSLRTTQQQKHAHIAQNNFLLFMKIYIEDCGSKRVIWRKTEAFDEKPGIMVSLWERKRESVVIILFVFVCFR